MNSSISSSSSGSSTSSSSSSSSTIVALPENGNPARPTALQSAQGCDRSRETRQANSPVTFTPMVVAACSIPVTQITKKRSCGRTLGGMNRAYIPCRRRFGHRPWKGLCAEQTTKAEAHRTAERSSAQMRILRWASVAGVPDLGSVSHNRQTCQSVRTQDSGLRTKRACLYRGCCGFDSRHANNQKAVLWSNLGWGAYVTLQAPTWPSSLHGMCSGMITKALRTAERSSAQMRILRWASVAGVPWDWEATASALCHCCGHNGGCLLRLHALFNQSNINRGHWLRPTQVKAEASAQARDGVHDVPVPLQHACDLWCMTHRR